jgi:hypothetical protein
MNAIGINELGPCPKALLLKTNTLFSSVNLKKEGNE